MKENRDSVLNTNELIEEIRVFLENPKLSDLDSLLTAVNDSQDPVVILYAWEHLKPLGEARCDLTIGPDKTKFFEYTVLSTI